MPFVTRDDDGHLSFDRQLQEGFVIRVGQPGNPIWFELALFGGGAKSVQNGINIFQRESHLGSVTFANLLVLEQEMVAQNHLPMTVPKFGKNLEGRAVS